MLRGGKFSGDDVVKEAIQEWLKAQKKLFYSDIVRKLMGHRIK
jgi:hypothetical protein